VVIVANNENLKKISSTERARELGSKGGKASAEVRRKKKNFKDTLKLMLDLPLLPSEKEFLKGHEVDEDEQTKEMMLIVSLYRKAIKGDVAAFKEIKALKEDDEW
jgi:hypothetical protein